MKKGTLTLKKMGKLYQDAVRYEKKEKRNLGLHLCAAVSLGRYTRNGVEDCGICGNSL